MRVSLYLISVLASSTLWADEGALELAKNSGCLACHAIERKVIGPAWKDVAARYKDDQAMRIVLINKIKAGGKGNWLEVTNGATMPPYFPRVKDEDIEELVSFILSL